PEPRERHEMLQQPDEKQRQALQWLWRQIAEAAESAPDDLILAAAHTAEPAKTPAILAALIPRTGDILIATGRTRSGEFTLRDALLLETLIKQAELSFENLEYYEQLQGRIVAADQELQEAHRLLIEQSTKLMAAVENIDSAMIVTDPRGNAIFVNSTSAEI